MKTSRQRLLDYINSHRTVTVAEISHALRMTPANARHHLNILINSGQVEVIGQAPAKGKGRPAKIYGPSSQKMGHNLDELASALLSLIQHQSKHQQASSLEKLAGLLAQSPAKQSGVSPHDHLTKRLFNTVNRFNQYHYQARWEAHQQAPRIILGHCPYHAIIDRHPELCQVDAHLLTHLLKEPVKQINKLSKDQRGRTHCAFRIQQ